MRKKCAYCFSRLPEEGVVCAVCGIDSKKGKSALSAQEKKLADRYRTLYTIGFLCIVGGLIGLFVFLPMLFFVAGGQKNHNLGSPSPFLPIYAGGIFLLLIAFLPFGLALRQYKKWCYAGGIAFFSIFIFLSILDTHILSLLAGGYFLYCVISPPSRQIFFEKK